MKYLNKKQGSAIPFALIFSMMLLELALAYMYTLQNARPQTGQVDERVRLNYLATGLTEIALLKFQNYPADYYYCWELAQKANDYTQLNNYTSAAPEFTAFKTLSADDLPSTSYDNTPIEVSLATMTLQTDNRWNTEVMTITVDARYKTLIDKKTDTAASFTRTILSIRENKKLFE